MFTNLWEYSSIWGRVLLSVRPLSNIFVQAYQPIRDNRTVNTDKPVPTMSNYNGKQGCINISDLTGGRLF